MIVIVSVKICSILVTKIVDGREAKALNILISLLEMDAYINGDDELDFDRMSAPISSLHRGWFR